MRKKVKKVVFLDRDGVINKDSPEYIKHHSEFEFLPGSINAVKNLNSNGFDVIVITNQSAVHRKMMLQQELDIIHLKMKTVITGKGGNIKDIFYCPHTPEEKCRCRKPEPGMIQAAVQKFGINLSTSVMVGDSVKDIECAKNAGCGYAVLVRTGNGKTAEKKLLEKNIFPDHVAGNLYDAADWIIAHVKS